MAYDTIFREKAPWIMENLIKDFDISVQDAAAILGNLGHESGGFKFLQEKKPMVAGSAGGYGWPQWTGPRRRAYEAYCKRNNLDPASDKANYAYLFIELKFQEKNAIPSIKGDNDSLDKDVQDFEKAFERAGVKHYDSRVKWAKIALDAWNNKKPVQQELKLPAPEKPQPKPELKLTPKIETPKQEGWLTKWWKGV